MSYKVGVTTACLEIWGTDLGSCSAWRKTQFPTKHTWVKFVQGPDHTGEYSESPQPGLLLHVGAHLVHPSFQQHTWMCWHCLQPRCPLGRCPHVGYELLGMQCQAAWLKGRRPRACRGPPWSSRYAVVVVSPVLPSSVFLSVPPCYFPLCI